MKYWGYLVAKLAVAGVFLYGLFRGMLWALPRPQPLFTVTDPFLHNLGYTVAIMIYTLVATAVIWGVIRDQRYRCRTCVRKLRMPIATGSWTHVLLTRPRTEYICPYGHGTLKVEELQITGHQEPDWQPHADIWKELESLEESKQ